MDIEVIGCKQFNNDWKGMNDALNLLKDIIKKYKPSVSMGELNNAVARRRWDDYDNEYHVQIFVAQ